MNLLFIPALAVCSQAQTPLATPVTTIPVNFSQNISFPPVGLASTETLQVNVVNVASNPANVSTGAAAASCTGSISFFNAAGTAIGTATNFTVASGQIASATLMFVKAGITGNRGEVRAVIQTNTMLGHGAPPCSLQSSLETFDTVSGATHIYLSNTLSVPAGIYGVLSALP